MRRSRVTLKTSVYVLREPVSQAYIAIGEGSKRPRLVTEIHRASLAPATPECLARLAERASARLEGVPYELERVDAL